MNELQAVLSTVLPPNRKVTSGGWISFNAVCCHNRGNRPDTKKRGGVLFTDEGFTYHCFNCGFKAGWSPGKLLSGNTKLLLKWCGLGDTDISKLGLMTLKLKDNQPIFKKILNFELTERLLPDDCLLISDWIKAGCEDTDFINVVDYIVSYDGIKRGMSLDWYDWMWSPAPGYVDRALIPFYDKGKIVGYTGRKIKDGNPKYLTDAQSGYVFNIDRQQHLRKYVIVVEGQFDAIAIDGCAIMHNEPNETQIMRLNALGKEVIIVPDKDRPGAKILKSAIDNKWSVSLPPWENDIKDVADAVKRYGRLYALTTILHYRVSNEIKIQLLKKKLENLTDE